MAGCTIPVHSIEFQGVPKRMLHILKAKSRPVFWVFYQMYIASRLITIY